MKSLRPFLALLIISVLFNSCKKEDAQPQAPTNLAVNGDLEAYPWPAWGFYFGYNLESNPNGYTNDYSIEAAASATHSIKIKCDAVKNDTTFCYLFQRYSGANIPVGARLTLKAKIRTVNLQGNGLSLAIRGDKTGQTKYTFFTTTEGKTPISGTSDFKEYSVTFDAYPGNTDYVNIFLLYLPKTTGSAFFDDISLTVN